MEHKEQLNKTTVAGLLVALGIIYGDIGTSPLYVMKAIVGEENPIQSVLVYGGISCIFWTLTLQTTFKYVILTLRADNNGEGGIFALYALVRRHAKWLAVPAIIGGSALLADGIITPPISVSSAVEGLRLLYPHIETVPIVIGILTGLFLLQSFGTTLVGKAFGPMMLLWFLMLGILGIINIVQDVNILKALNPYYGYQMLVNYPNGFWLLGAVFLCTTGAEALYSDLGHCGRGNIRVSWVFVKTSLLLNYFGQGAWLLGHEGMRLVDINARNPNPFYLSMPEEFVLFGLVIATLAAIIASQALISGSFTLISEAIRLNFWPKVLVTYPTEVRGQLYVPSINLLLWVGCVGVVLYFRESSHMEAAYGLAITLTMLMTTTLLAYYLYTIKGSLGAVVAFLVVFLSIEISFLIANLLKFPEGGWVSLAIGAILAYIMYTWQHAAKIKTQHTEYVSLPDKIPQLQELSQDQSVPKYATHMVFMTSALGANYVETAILESIFLTDGPKRADIYWLLHVETLDDPYTMAYKVDVLAPEDVIKITFRLGFRIEPRINLFFKRVVEEMVRKKEVDITSRYESLHRQNITGDFQFLVFEKFLSYENELPWHERLTMLTYFFIKRFTLTNDRWFKLDRNTVKMEQVPLLIKPVENVELIRLPETAETPMNSVH
jgi:KUP system potassium uptake protein